MKGKLTKIPATITAERKNIPVPGKKLRVAAYARVSTRDELQLTSIESQITYYSGYIGTRPGWELAGVYADHGLSGTGTRNRAGFNRMIKDALDGKIDLILTKSVSRFARNTVDSITVIRKLRAKNVDVYFEKENISILDAKGEILLTIMSSLAQEESRSISENEKWGLRKGYKEGRFHLSAWNLLGYDLDDNGKLVINREQAGTVKRIYGLFTQGKSLYEIKKILENDRTNSPDGKTWHVSSIKKILKNEKYRGDILLQKTYTKDFLTKKRVKNDGDIPQYYIENDHEPIIPPDIFDKVQDELSARDDIAERKIRYSTYGCKLVCGICGEAYNKKDTPVATGTPFQCPGISEGKRCRCQKTYKRYIRKAFIDACNSLTDKKELLKYYENASDVRNDISSQIADIKEKLDKACMERERLINDNCIKAQDQKEYKQKEEKITDEIKSFEEELKELRAAADKERIKAAEERMFTRDLTETDKYTEFSLLMWERMVEKAVVYSKEDISIIFRHQA